MVKPGYKQSEVGEIPEDWDATYIKDIAGIRVAKDVDESRISDEPDYKYQYPVYSNTVDIPGIYGYYDYPEYSGNLVTVVGRGVGLGTAICREGGFGAIGRLIVLNPKSNSVFLSKYINHKIDVFKESSGVPQLTGIALGNYKIAFPPDNEQETIAEALSDVDELIVSLEKLIAKKRDIKTAAMQQLLTGKKRLPGFGKGKGTKQTELGEIPEDWEVAKFHEVANLRKSKIDPKLTGGGEICIELENIDQNTGTINGSTITSAASSHKSLFNKNDVLFGKLRSYLRKYWVSEFEGVCSTEIWVLQAVKGKSIPQFIFQAIRTDKFIECASEAHGTHMPRADWGVVKEFILALPSTREQEVICSVLSDLDKEIVLHNNELEKTKSIKQGMMQELLTGRTRLVELQATEYVEEERLHGT